MSYNKDSDILNLELARWDRSIHPVLLSQEETRVTDPNTGGQKGSKLERFDLIPTGPLNELAALYGRGAKKYDENNWRKSYAWSLSYAAALRHLTAFWGGEDLDEETRTKHVINAAFHCFALAEFMEKNRDKDDRFVSKPKENEQLRLFDA